MDYNNPDLMAEGSMCVRAGRVLFIRQCNHLFIRTFDFVLYENKKSQNCYTCFKELYFLYELQRQMRSLKK